MPTKAKESLQEGKEGRSQSKLRNCMRRGTTRMKTN